MEGARKTCCRWTKHNVAKWKVNDFWEKLVKKLRVFGEKVKYDDVRWMFFINIDAITAARNAPARCHWANAIANLVRKHRLMVPLLIVPHLIELQNWFTTVNKTDAVNEVSDSITLVRQMHSKFGFRTFRPEHPRMPKNNQLFGKESLLILDGNFLRGYLKMRDSQIRDTTISPLDRTLS